MYNYNLINPININYRNPKQDPNLQNGDEKRASSNESDPAINPDGRGQRHFPNGNKVQIDYTKNKVNIAQVLEDFKSTIAAINAPDNVANEVNVYLGLVEAESKKENPSREIILSNLKNASKISDKFIQDSLKKPSTVVEDWVNALFMQQVELKSDPSFINEDFRVQIPNKKGAQGASQIANAASSKSAVRAAVSQGAATGYAADVARNAEIQGVSVQNSSVQNPHPFVQSAQNPQVNYTQPAQNFQQNYAQPVQTQTYQMNDTAQYQIPSAYQAQYQAPVQPQTPTFTQNIDTFENQTQTPVEPALDIISKTDDTAPSASNSPLNIYDVPQNQITIGGIKPIGQADPLYFAQHEQIQGFRIIDTPVQPAPAQITPSQPSGTDDFIDFKEVEAQLQIAQDYENKLNLTYSTTAAQSAAAPNEPAVSFENNGVYKLSTINENAPAKKAQDIQTPAPKSAEIKQIPVHKEVQTPATKEEIEAKQNFIQAKKIIKENGSPLSALQLYTDALSLAQNSGNVNLKAAIHYERGTVYDDYDRVELALRDYNNATKCTDNNLKAHAHLKMGKIYDDYVMFDPAVKHYSLALDSSEEAGNPAGKTKALRQLAALFADRYDKENTEIFNTFAVDAAYETKSAKTVAKTLREAAQNYEYIGEDVKALKMYKQAAKVLYDTKDYKMLSMNYEDASNVMERLGNEAKAMSLLSKALLYQQKSEPDMDTREAQA